MKLTITLAAALLLVAAAARAEVKVGDSPELTFRSTDGKNVDLKALRGKLVLIDFWATWCGPCMAEAGHMVETNNKYGPKGLQIIGISLDDDRAALENVIKSQNFSWPQFFDGQGWGNRFARGWGVKSIPRTFLLDTNGTVVWSGHPGRMDQPIEEAFAKTPPQLIDPAVAVAAAAMLEQVEASIKSGDNAGAIKRFAALPPEARKDPQIDERAKSAESQLATAATAMLADVEPMIQQKQFAPAQAKLKELAAALGTSEAAAQAKKRLSELNAMPEAQAQFAAAAKTAKADEELAVAQKLQADGKHELAYARFKQIVKSFEGTTAATSAAEAVAKYEQDPAFTKRANETTGASKAKGLLALAQSYRKSNRLDLARKKYQEVIDTYPNTSFADEASKALKEMN